MGKRLSFAEIGELSDRAAKGLRAIGVGEGVKVGLLLPNTPTFVIFYYGVLKAGGTVVNFNPLYSLEEIEAQIRDSGAKIMVTLDLAMTFDKVEAMLRRGALDKAVIASFPALLPVLKSVGFKLLQRTKLADPSSSLAANKIVTDRELLANDGRCESPRITPDAIAVLQYTGGTTGTPKGAMLTHANISTNVNQVKRWRQLDVRAGDSILGILPLFHVFAMTTVMNFGIASGMEMILVPKFELIDTLKLIGKLRPRMMPVVPTLLNAMLRHPHIGNFDLSSLEYCLSGGAPLPLEVKRRFEALCGCSVVEGYGLSETSPVACCNLPEIEREGSIGLPLPATEISIRSLDDPHVEVAPGETGELCIAGPQVMTGYWQKPEETEGSFVGRFFRTGDVGYMDPDGFLYIVDRIKDMIITGGENVYSTEVENVVAQYPGVLQCAVIGIPHPQWGEAVHAVVVVKEGASFDPADLIGFCKERIGGYKCPRSVDVRTEPLPMSGAGKILKRELRRPFWENRDRRVA